MVLGVGIDIVPIGRMHALWDRHRARLCESVFTRQELTAGGLTVPAGGGHAGAQLTARQVRYLAERFAGKEATIKVMGVGHATEFELNEIEVLGSRNLEVSLRGPLQAMAARKGIGRLRGSCSSTTQTTVVLMIGESQDG